MTTTTNQEFQAIADLFRDKRIKKPISKILVIKDNYTRSINGLIDANLSERHEFYQKALDALVSMEIAFSPAEGLYHLNHNPDKKSSLLAYLREKGIDVNKSKAEREVHIK